MGAYQFNRFPLIYFHHPPSFYIHWFNSIIWFQSHYLAIDFLKSQWRTCFIIYCHQRPFSKVLIALPVVDAFSIYYILTCFSDEAIKHRVHLDLVISFDGVWSKSYSLRIVMKLTWQPVIGWEGVVNRQKLSMKVVTW